MINQITQKEKKIDFKFLDKQEITGNSIINQKFKDVDFHNDLFEMLTRAYYQMCLHSVSLIHATRQ